ncbi:18561_t:CDS:1, partial [Racocetra persica]
PSMTMQKFDLQSPKQLTYPPITLTSSFSFRIVPNHLGPTSANKELWSEIEMLNKKIEDLESELDLYKNP